MTSPYLLNYHPCYLRLLDDLDKAVRLYVQSKERLVSASPLSNSFLRHELTSFRYYRNKIRIVYTLHSEHPELWSVPPPQDEIMLLYVGLRNNDTYGDAYKILASEGLI